MLTTRDVHGLNNVNTVLIIDVTNLHFTLSIQNISINACLILTILYLSFILVKTIEFREYIEHRSKFKI